MSLRNRLWDFFSRFDPFAKPVTCLTWADLARHPIWEYALNTEGLPWRDETWVRPVKRATIPWNGYSLTVAATLVTRSGKSFDGSAYVSTAGGSVDVPMGMMFVGRECYDIPNPRQNREHESRSELVAAAGGTIETVFPIRWTLKVRMEGENEFRSGHFTGSG